GLWHLWASCHPLADPLHTDQMTSEYATSADGVTWTWQGTALSGTPGRWDSRGTRVTSASFDGDAVTAWYDGRASAAENYEERTGGRIQHRKLSPRTCSSRPMSDSNRGMSAWRCSQLSCWRSRLCRCR